MATIVADCPRCEAKKQTFDIGAQTPVGRGFVDWQLRFEVTCVCRQCIRPTIFKLELSLYGELDAFRRPDIWLGTTDVTKAFDNLGPLVAADLAAETPPASLPPEIDASFAEGAKCLSVRCYNAAGAMFRLCIDQATKARLPEEGIEGGPDKNQRRNLAPRLRWLFECGGLPQDLRPLFEVVKTFGDDGAHDGTLTKEDAADLLDFARALLERLHTEPSRLAEAQERAKLRRNPETAK